MSVFFDSHAIIEIIKNGKNYDKYANFQIITSTLNVAEVYYFLLRIQDKKTADYLIKKMDFKLANMIRLDIALKSSRFKFENKKEKLSYTDCIGYFLAQEMNLKFLTGDEKFKNKGNVEFIK